MSPELTLTPAPEVVERALASSRADGCVVIVRETSSVNARFAVNTATSNGRIRSREVTIVSIVDGAEGVAAASVGRSGAIDVVELVAESDALARSAPAAPDAAPLTTGEVDVHFAVEPPETSHDELVAVVAGLARAFPEAARAQGDAGRIRRAHRHDHLPRHLSRAAPTVRPAHWRVSVERTHRGGTELRVVERRRPASGHLRR